MNTSIQPDLQIPGLPSAARRPRVIPPECNPHAARCFDFKRGWWDSRDHFEREISAFEKRGYTIASRTNNRVILFPPDRERG